VSIIPPWVGRVLKGIGFANFFFSLIGFVSLFCILIAFSFFSKHEFFDQKLPFFNSIYIIMITFNLAFLLGLGITGFALLRGSIRSVMLCNILFFLEITYFYSLKMLLRLPEFQHSPNLMFVWGIGNAGIGLQVLPFYPIIAIVVLNFLRFKFKDSFQVPDTIDQKKDNGQVQNISLCITLFALWFMLWSLASMVVAIYDYRFNGISQGQNIQILFLQDYCALVLGFFIFKRKEWARRGILILTAGGFLLAMAYNSVPNFKDSLQKDQTSTQRQQIKRQEALLERIENQDPYNYEELSKFINDVNQKTYSQQENLYFNVILILFYLLWFLFVYFFFTNPRVKEQFTWDPGIDKSGRYFIRFLVFFCVIAVCCSLIFPSQVRLHFSRGLDYRNRGEWGKSFQEYSMAIWFDPQNKELYMRRGYVLEKMGNASQALKDYDKALELDPFFTQVLINRSLIYYNWGMYKDALGDALVVVKHEPQNDDGQLCLGSFYERLKRPLSALVHTKIAEKINPQDPMAHSNLANIYSEIGDYKNGIEEANKAIALDPKSSAAYRNRAANLFIAKDFIHYAQDWMMVYKLDPTNLEAPYWALYGYYRAGDTPKVKELQAIIPKGIISPLRGLGLTALLAQDHADEKVTGFDPQKSIRYERSFMNGRLNGPARDFSKDGQLLNDFNYSDGLINGSWKIYNNGRLQEEWDYKEDMADGFSKQYASDGKLKCSWSFANGQRNGPYTCFYPNGILQWQGYYKIGFLDGLDQSYYENGMLTSKQHYKLGDMDGQQQYFDEKGKIVSEYIYKDGKVVQLKIYRKV